MAGQLDETGCVSRRRKMCIRDDDDVCMSHSVEVPQQWSSEKGIDSGEHRQIVTSPQR